LVAIKLKSSKPLDVNITLPGSKYLANRLLILSALATGESTLINMPINDDILTAIKGLSLLGANFIWSDHTLRCTGIHWNNVASELHINSHHSGSFSRFVLPLLAISERRIHLSGSDKMNTRPMGELFKVLEKLGAHIESNGEQTLPISIQGPLIGGTVEMSGETSSQYISALLLSGAAFPKGIHIELSAEPVSKPYLEMTADLLSTYGVNVIKSDDLKSFDIQPNQTLQAVEYELESDPSSASYFLAAAAITAGHICITNFVPEQSLQGEAKFSDLLKSMGCKIWSDDSGYHCQGPECLKPISVDMCDMPDVVQTLAVVASFAEGKTEITNIATLAFKESNRIEDTATELRKLNLKVETTADSITILGVNNENNLENNVTFDTYDDHRMAMSLALFSLRLNSVKMNDHQVVSKSFPTYWNYMEQLNIEIIN